VESLDYKRNFTLLGTKSFVKFAIPHIPLLETALRLRGGVRPFAASVRPSADHKRDETGSIEEAEPNAIADKGAIHCQVGNAQQDRGQHNLASQKDQEEDQEGMHRKARGLGHPLKEVDSPAIQTTLVAMPGGGTIQDNTASEDDPPISERMPQFLGVRMEPIADSGNPARPASRAFCYEIQRAHRSTAI
jgi:hypothetical protein